MLPGSMAACSASAIAAGVMRSAICPRTYTNPVPHFRALSTALSYTKGIISNTQDRLYAVLCGPCRLPNKATNPVPDAVTRVAIARLIAPPRLDLKRLILVATIAASLAAAGSCSVLRNFAVTKSVHHSVWSYCMPLPYIETTAMADLAL